MNYIITRTNNKVRQIWQKNDANWDYFLGGMSNDVHWSNDTDRHRMDKIFPSFDIAYSFLQQRNKHLRGTAKKQDKQWAYHIEEVQK